MQEKPAEQSSGLTVAPVARLRLYRLSGVGRRLAEAVFSLEMRSALGFLFMRFVLEVLRGDCLLKGTRE